MNQTLAPVLAPPLLLAVDGSASARSAQQMIRPIAELLQAHHRSNPSVLTVVTVQPRVSRRGRRENHKAQRELGQTATIVSAQAAHESTLAVENLTALVREDFAVGFPLTVEVRQGRPVTEILNCARSLQAGLIAVGHRGVGGMRELMLGSVSTAIARYAPCSVLVARTPPKAIAPGWQHVLVVVDDAIATRHALALVRQFADAGIQRVTLLHVQSPVNANYLVGPFVSPNPSWQLSQSLQSAQKEEGENILHQAKATLEHTNLTVQTRLQTGDPGPLLCQVAQEVQANLILLGSDLTRRSLLSPLQAFRGDRPVLRNTRLSVTEDYVIHYAPCAVLLCRAN